MSLVKWSKDSFGLGFVFGGLSLLFIYFCMSAIRSAIVSYTGNIYVLRPPTIQLFTMVINVIFFRILMINLNREKTAKGFLFVIVIATLVYFAIFYRMNK